MSPVTLAFKEIFHRRNSSMFAILLIAAITGTLTFFVVNSQGFEKEVGRNVRDIGSNIVILPAKADQFAYHQKGGYNEETMPYLVVDQLVEFRASLNHLIPMLERPAECQFKDESVMARVVGLLASIAVPGRPKAPMQKSIAEGKVQIGSELAKRLGLSRETSDASVVVSGKSFPVQRINRGNGTWQDSAVFMDLPSAQKLFDLEKQITRIEAIECTQEKCEETGQKSDVVLTNELARITDQAVLLRREQMADARLNVRALSQRNLNLLKNLLWAFLAISMIGLGALNSNQRKSEIGVLQSVGFGQSRVAMLFLMRTLILGLIGCCIGVVVGAMSSVWQSKTLFESTGKKLVVDWTVGITIGLVAIGISILATLIPVVWSASQHPADLIGEER